MTWDYNNSTLRILKLDGKFPKKSTKDNKDEFNNSMIQTQQESNESIDKSNDRQATAESMREWPKCECNECQDHPEILEIAIPKNALKNEPNGQLHEQQTFYRQQREQRITDAIELLQMALDKVKRK